MRLHAMAASVATIRAPRSLARHGWRRALRSYGTEEFDAPFWCHRAQSEYRTQQSCVQKKGSVTSNESLKRDFGGSFDLRPGFHSHTSDLRSSRTVVSHEKRTRFVECGELMRFVSWVPCTTAGQRLRVQSMLQYAYAQYINAYTDGNTSICLHQYACSIPQLLQLLPRTSRLPSSDPPTLAGMVALGLGLHLYAELGRPKDRLTDERRRPADEIEVVQVGIFCALGTSPGLG